MLIYGKFRRKFRRRELQKLPHRIRLELEQPTLSDKPDESMKAGALRGSSIVRQCLLVPS